MKRTVALLAFACIPSLMQAQTADGAHRDVKYGFPQLKNAPVSGSPILGQPMLVQGTTAPVKGEGMGWADPVLFDWNKDGKKDLLIGEFFSNRSMPDSIKYPNLKGSHLRVYLNVGTNESPKFTNDFEYAKDKTGAYLNVNTACCIGFTSRFPDLNNDGYIDIVTGSYIGQITCYYGSANGFESPVDIEQQDFPDGGEVKLGLPIDDPKGEFYWVYSSADFVDVDGDGLLDLITGGSVLRVSKNIGTKTKPAFGKKKFLYNVNGNYLALSGDTISTRWSYGGIYGAVPLVTDWDQDGVADLLVTNSYVHKADPAISFFRGVKMDNELRFESAVSLFSSADSAKQFPGSWLRTWVSDWNNDGINDLIVGASVPLTGEGEGQLDPMLAWTWETTTGITKSSPKYFHKLYPEYATKEYPYTKMLVKRGIINEADANAFNAKMLTMMHQGYVYVLLGTGTYGK